MQEINKLLLFTFHGIIYNRIEDVHIPVHHIAEEDSTGRVEDGAQSPNVRDGSVL